jgi:spermidine synthase
VNRSTSTYCFALAFLGGFNVMVLEMCAFRTLAITFGSSIYVSGALLALVMVALSAGYVVGGRLSMRRQGLGLLLWMILGAVVYTHVVHVVMGNDLLDAAFGLRSRLTGSLALQIVPPSVATLVLYLPPMLMLSQISPFLIKFISDPAKEGAVGVTAGNVMALSTIGSIAGTTLPSFFLIPLFGVERTLWVFELSLLAVIAAGHLLFRERKVVAALSTGLLLLVALQGFRSPESNLGMQNSVGSLILEKESRYGTIRIFQSEEDGVEGYTFMPSRSYAHTTIYPQAPLKDQFTTAHLLVGTLRGSKHYLVLGAALGGVVAGILELDPEARITAVEIDPEVVELAKRYAPQLAGPNVEWVVEDARVFLKEDRNTYDYAIVDIFAGEQIPAHCVTQEFFALVKQRLAPGGVLEMNTNLWDFHIQSGLEEEAPFVPVRHLHSSLMNAGFASLFQNDFFEHGHLYAFQEPTELEDLRAQFLAAVQDPAVDPHLRAAAGIAWLQLVEVPPERKFLRPFDDQWVPEHLLHLKHNFERYLQVLADARSLPAWQSEVENSPELRHLSARHYARLAAVAPTYDGFEAYMAGAGGAAYCGELLTWADGARGNYLEDLARHVQGSSLPHCAAHLPPAETLLAAGRPRAAALRRFFDAAVLVTSNQGAAAAPLLGEVTRALLET